MSKTVEPGDLVQVNEDGPAHWFRCILVVDEVKPWGVHAYCTVPNPRDQPSGDAYMRLTWEEFDVLGVKSKFVTCETLPACETDD
jgi:hypothetical protein